MPNVPVAGRRALFAAPVVLAAALLAGGLGAALSSCDSAGCEGGALVVEDLALGDGAEATAGSTVTIAYVGTLEDGTEFDRRTRDFVLSNALEGLREGIVGMRVGGRRLITIPPELAYGKDERPGIPSCSTLLFDIELLGVE